MKGDRVLCMNPACHQMTRSIHDDLHNTRDPKKKDLCPYCGGTNTVNVEYIIGKYWKNPKNLREGGLLISLPEDIAFIIKLLKNKGVKLVKQLP